MYIQHTKNFPYLLILVISYLIMLLLPEYYQKRTFNRKINTKTNLWPLFLTGAWDMWWGKQYRIGKWTMQWVSFEWHDLLTRPDQRSSNRFLVGVSIVNSFVFLIDMYTWHASSSSCLEIADESVDLPILFCPSVFFLFIIILQKFKKHLLK